MEGFFFPAYTTFHLQRHILGSFISVIDYNLNNPRHKENPEDDRFQAHLLMVNKLGIDKLLTGVDNAEEGKEL